MARGAAKVAYSFTPISPPFTLNQPYILPASPKYMPLSFYLALSFAPKTPNSPNDSLGPPHEPQMSNSFTMFQRAIGTHALRRHSECTHQACGYDIGFTVFLRNFIINPWVSRLSQFPRIIQIVLILILIFLCTFNKFIIY